MKIVALPKSWTLSAVNPGKNVPSKIASTNIQAKVPGCVHTDLLAAGLIEEPY